MAASVAVVWLLVFLVVTAVASNENTTAHNLNFTALYGDVEQNDTFVNSTPSATGSESSTVLNTVSEAPIDAAIGPGSAPLAVSGRLPTPVADVGSVCSCDEHGDLCDINCCCDRDCRQDLALFTGCLLPTISGNKHLCSDDSASYDLQSTAEGYSQLRSSVQKETFYHAFCIQSQNRVDGFSFPAPALPMDSNFDLLFKQFNRFAFNRAEKSIPMSSAVPNTFYQYGDVIVTAKENGQRGILWLPSFGVTLDCVDQSPTAFLVDMRSRCTRRVNLKKNCTSLSALKAETYTKISLLAHTNENATVVPVQTTSVVLQSLDGTQHELELNGDEAIDPYFMTPDVCANVVLEVAYVVTYAVSGQIVKAAVRLLLGHLRATPVAVEQDFAIAFIQENSENVPMQNSGHPGYVMGRPLLSGRATSEGIVRHLGDTLSIHQSSSNHNCLSGPHQRSPVLFGVESTSGCTLRLEEATNCSLVSHIILDVLQGQNYPQLVAAFGNSPLDNSLDWVPIQHIHHPTDTQACSIPLSLDLQIEWTKYGHKLNPQAQIVSVKQVVQSNTSSLVSNHSVNRQALSVTPIKRCFP